MAQNNSNNEIQVATAIITGGKEGLKNLLFYNAITHGLPFLLNTIGGGIKGIVQRKVRKQLECMANVSSRKKSASITLCRDYEKGDTSNSIFDAILAHVSELPQTKHVKRTPSGIFIMASNEHIEVSPSIYVCKIAEKVADDILAKLTIEVFSYEYSLTILRKFLEEIEDKYNMALANQLGKNIYYFDELPVNLPLGYDKKPDLSRAARHINFSSYVLHTNKSLKNLYGDAVGVVRKRMNFFLNNKRWYEEKGVPYTLGILLHGVPGAGKTSTIKSIAKDTNRHILNIKLTENTTISQLNNLFYSSSVHVVQNGVNKLFEIPIDKRIIVLEDVDCLTEIVLERSEKKEPQKANDTSAPNSQSSSITSNEQVNLSTLLNILDGVLEQPGRILIMTSNHPEKLDRALIRPGRIDVIVKFEHCKKHEITALVEAFTPYKVAKDDEEAFSDNVFTPAKVTQLIFENIDNIPILLQKLGEHPIVIDSKQVNNKLQEIEVNKPTTITEQNIVANVIATQNTKETKDTLETNIKSQVYDCILPSTTHAWDDTVEKNAVEKQQLVEKTATEITVEAYEKEFLSIKTGQFAPWEME
jgi:hypothetical protein